MRDFPNADRYNYKCPFRSDHYEKKDSPTAHIETRCESPSKISYCDARQESYRSDKNLECSPKHVHRPRAQASVSGDTPALAGSWGESAPGVGPREDNAAGEERSPTTARTAVTDTLVTPSVIPLPRPCAPAPSSSLGNVLDRPVETVDTGGGRGVESPCGSCDGLPEAKTRPMGGEASGDQTEIPMDVAGLALPENSEEKKVPTGVEDTSRHPTADRCPRVEEDGPLRGTLEKLDPETLLPGIKENKNYRFSNEKIDTFTGNVEVRSEFDGNEAGDVLEEITLSRLREYSNRIRPRSRVESRERRADEFGHRADTGQTCDSGKIGIAKSEDGVPGRISAGTDNIDDGSTSKSSARLSVEPLNGLGSLAPVTAEIPVTDSEEHGGATVSDVLVRFSPDTTGNSREAEETVPDPGAAPVTDLDVRTSPTEEASPVPDWNDESFFDDLMTNEMSLAMESFSNSFGEEFDVREREEYAPGPEYVEAVACDPDTPEEGGQSELQRADSAESEVVPKEKERQEKRCFCGKVFPCEEELVEHRRTKHRRGRPPGRRSRLTALLPGIDKTLRKKIEIQLNQGAKVLLKRLAYPYRSLLSRTSTPN